jgi:hypothetical protein
MALFDWREDRRLPTLAVRRLGEATFETDEERALAQALAAAEPALYRMGEPERRRTRVPLRPLFPAGEEIVVHDRALSLTAEDGWLVAARLYPAGPFTFARLAAPQVAPENGTYVRRRLARALRAFRAEGGEDDAAALLAARPGLLLQVLCSFRG